MVFAAFTIGFNLLCVPQKYHFLRYVYATFGSEILQNPEKTNLNVIGPLSLQIHVL